MTADLASFRAEFPEFSTTSDDAVNRFLALAKLIHTVREAATLYCTAHLLKLEQSREAGNVTSAEISSRGVGPMNASYLTQAETGRESFFTSTSYGKIFLTLEKRSARASIGAFVSR